MARELELWNPKNKAKKLQNPTDDWFSDFFAPSSIPFNIPRGLKREPLVDVVDKGKTIELTAELPGVDKRDIKINIEGNSVSIGAEQKHILREEDKKKGFYRQERSYQSFFRRLPLPAEVLPAKSSAEYTNGILKVSLQKKRPAEKKKAHKVQVK